MKAIRQRLDWLEVGRGLAAFGVVVTHYDPWRAVGLSPPSGVDFRLFGNFGVEFFFVLSGFIIAFVHGRDLSQPRALPNYAWRRLVRIFPTYWLVLAVALVFNQTLQNPDYRVHLTLPYFLKQLVLWPGGEPMLGPAWTLRHELLFYAVFAVAVYRRWLGVPLFLAWMAGATANLLVNGLPPGMVYDPAGIVLHHDNIDFLLGVLIAYAAARGRTGTALAVAGGSALVLLPLALSGVGDHAVLVTLTYKATFAAIVSLAVLVSRRGLRAPGLGVTLGVMSYALYISHIPVGNIFRGGLRHAVGWNAVWPVPRLLAEVAVALAAAWVLHRWFEVPMLRRLQRLRRGDPRPEIAAEA